MPDIDLTNPHGSELLFRDAVVGLLSSMRDAQHLDDVLNAVAQSAATVAQADTATFSETSSDRSLSEHRIVIPLSDASGRCGSIVATTEPLGRVFGEADLERLDRFGSVAAVSIETAMRLFEERPSPEPILVEDLRPLSDFDEVETWAMVETSPDGMILADEQGVMLLVNAQIEELFGYDRGELLGRTVEELLPDRHRQVHTAHRTRYRVDPKPRSMGSGLDLLARRKDGSEFPVEVSLAPVKTGEKSRVVATVRDITERVATEAFNSVVQRSIDAAQDGVFMFTADDLAFTYVNEGAASQLGYSRDELLAMTPLHIKPEFTERSFRDVLQPLLDNAVSSYSFSTVHRRKDGRDIPVEIILEYPLHVAPGQPRMLVAFVRDISERVRATQALQASEAAFRTTFEAAPVGIATVDFTDAVRRPIADCNAAFCDLLGYSKEELLTMGFADLTYVDDAQVSFANARQAASGDLAQYSMEKRYVHADGHPIWVWVHSAVLPDAEGNLTKGMVHVADLTERKQAEAERERARRWLAGLAEVRAAALADESLERTLELVCSHARSLIGADTAVIGRPDDGSETILAVAYDSPETAARLPDSFPIDEPLRQALLGESFLSSRLDQDGRVSEANRSGAGSLEEITAVLVVPIQAAESVDALLMMSHAQQDGIGDNDLTTIESFAAEAATVLQLHAARRAAAQLEVLEDRERLARDLHDLVIQRLFAAGMALQSVLGHVSNPLVSERVSSTVDQLDETIAELRSAIFRLNSPATVSVHNELTTIVDESAAQLGFQPTVDFHGDIESIPEVILEQLCPVLTEALSNVARHANATSVTVTVGITETEVQLHVIDNGAGLDPHAAPGNGLQNLESRASRVGGSATLTNNPDRGATLAWTARR